MRRGHGTNLCEFDYDDDNQTERIQLGSPQRQQQQQQQQLQQIQRYWANQDLEHEVQDVRDWLLLTAIKTLAWVSLVELVLIVYLFYRLLR